MLGIGSLDLHNHVIVLLPEIAFFIEASQSKIIPDTKKRNKREKGQEALLIACGK